MTSFADEKLWFGSDDTDEEQAEQNAAQSLAALAGRIIGTKPFPATARRLADLTRDETCRIELVVQVLESDPALSMRLLRLVNSAGYALRVPCTSVRHAAALVGSDRLHQIAVTAAVLDLFDSDSAVAAELFEHMAVVGALSRYLGAHLSLPADDLFTCGFLHDIGKLMLLETEQEGYLELLKEHRAHPDEIHHQERRRFGFDHALLAGHVLRAWNIPDPVPEVVAWHHQPVRASNGSNTAAAMVHTLRLADAVACALQNDEDHENNAGRLAKTESASYLEISEVQLAAMWEEMKTLSQRSREQCRGGAPPVLDAASLRPRTVVSVASPRASSTGLARQLPCVVCGKPTYGNTCPVCDGHVCPEHQIGSDDWCSLCEYEHSHQQASARIPLVVWIAFFSTSTVLLLGLLLAGESKLAVGSSLVLLLAAVLLRLGQRWWVRWRFLRRSRMRGIPATLTSLVPPPLEFPKPGRTSHLLELLQPPGRVSILQFDEPSQLPAEGGGGSVRCSDGPRAPEEASDVPGLFVGATSRVVSDSSDEPPSSTLAAGDAFADVVAERAAQQIAGEVSEKVAQMVAQAVIETAKDELVGAVAQRIADVWQPAPHVLLPSGPRHAPVVVGVNGTRPSRTGNTIVPGHSRVEACGRCAKSE